MAKLAAIVCFALVCGVVSAKFQHSSFPKVPRPVTTPPFNPHASKPGSLGYFRFRRSPDQWELRPDISRDENGNTRAQVELSEHGRNHDVKAGWAKNLRGPGSHKDLWHVGGSIRW